MKLRREYSIVVLLLVLLAGCQPSPTPTRTPQPSPTPLTPSPVPLKTVVLTMGSWRTDDVEQMNRILARFHELPPNITVRYLPTQPQDYDRVLRAQLESDMAPDLFYLRSYSVSRALYEAGYLADLSDLPGLRENFAPEMLAPWSTDDGVAYGVPFIATSHGIYYNVDIFNNLGLALPQTWEELLATAQVLRANGYIPFANASGDTWTMAELVFMNLAPNFVGGYEGRQAYLRGERCFNDQHIVALFEAIRDLAPYLPPGQGALTYYDSLQLFLQGRAAMWLGGSWDIPYFEQQNTPFTWSVMAVPPPAGQPGYVTFHLDAGMGLNSASIYQKEARQFLEWMTTPEFGSLMGNELPGFFPMHNTPIRLENSHANAFLALNQGRGTDVRFVWEKLRDGTPSAYDLVEAGTVGVVNGTLTPRQAADRLQEGLEQWFGPAQTCRP